MNFYDNFSTIRGYAANAAQAVSKKAKQVAAIAKANVSILAEEDKVRKAQTELGKVYYKDYVLGEEPDLAEYLPWCEKITASLKLIDDLKETIEHAKQSEEAEEPAPAAEEAESLPEIVVVEEEAPAEEAQEEAAEEAPAQEAPAEEAPAEEQPE